MTTEMKDLDICTECLSVESLQWHTEEIDDAGKELGNYYCTICGEEQE